MSVWGRVFHVCICAVGCSIFDGVVLLDCGIEEFCSVYMAGYDGDFVRLVEC